MLLAEYGLGLGALYLLSPALLGAFFGSLRGYGGDINAVKALETLNADGGAVIVDIRSEVGSGVELREPPLLCTRAPSVCRQKSRGRI